MTSTPQPSPAVARKVDPSEATALGHVLARSFATDPVWAYLTGSRFPRFETDAVPFFARETRHHLELDAAYTVDGKVGAYWAPPKRWKTGFGDVVKLVPSAIKLFGTRIPKALATLNEAEKQHPTEPHWYLALLGTDPDHQGKGFGSAALAPILGRCDEEGTPAYLESSKEENVPFYERHGFEVTSTLDLGKGKGPRMWLMWREPQPPDARP